MESLPFGASLSGLDPPFDKLSGNGFKRPALEAVERNYQITKSTLRQCRGHAAQSEPRAGSTEEFGDSLHQKLTVQDQILSTAQAHREAGRGSCGMVTAPAQRAL